MLSRLLHFIYILYLVGFIFLSYSFYSMLVPCNFGLENRLLDKHNTLMCISYKPAE